MKPTDPAPVVAAALPEDIERTLEAYRRAADCDEQFYIRQSADDALAAHRAAISSELGRLTAERDEARAMMAKGPHDAASAVTILGLISDLRLAKEKAARAESRASAAADEVERLRQAHWDGRAIGGFDNDGDPTPRAVASDFAALIRSDWKQARADWDEMSAEEDAAATRAKAAADVVRELLGDSKCERHSYAGTCLSWNEPPCRVCRARAFLDGEAGRKEGNEE